MDKDISFIKEVSDHLKCPRGKRGLEIAQKMNVSNQELMKETLVILNPCVGEKIIEIVMGNGILSIPLIESLGVTGQFCGLDLSETMIEEASIHLKKYKNIILKNSDLTDFKSKEKYDKLIAVNVLYFIKDLDLFFKSIKINIKESGLVVFGLRTQKTLNNIPISKFNFISRSEDSILDMLKGHGFKEIKKFLFTEKERAERQVDTQIEFENIIISFRV